MCLLCIGFIGGLGLSCLVWCGCLMWCLMMGGVGLSGLISSIFVIEWVVGDGW